MEINEMAREGPIRVVRSTIVEEVIPGLSLPGFDFDIAKAGPDVVGEAFHKLFKDKPQEEIWALYLQNYKLIAVAQIGIGTVSSVGLDNRLIVKQALDVIATEVMLVHSHVLRGIDPSEQDANATKNLAEILGIFGVLMMEHFIIGPEGWTTITKKYPYCIKADRNLDPLKQRTVDPAANLQELLGGLLSSAGLDLPPNVVPRGPALSLEIDFSSPETEEQDIVRITNEIQAMLDSMEKQPQDGEILGLVVTTPRGPLRITENDDVEDTVRSIIAPLLKGEEPTKPMPPFEYPKPNSGGIADQLRDLDN